MKKILTTFVVMMITAGFCFADELTVSLLSRRKVKTRPLVYERQIPSSRNIEENKKTEKLEKPEKIEKVEKIEKLDKVEREIAEIPSVFKEYKKSPQEVEFGSTRNWINAINPNSWNNRAGAGFPGGRGANQLVVYTPDYGYKTGTNEYGAEAIVEGNIVTELSGADSHIPKNGVVISGHGQAKKWINSALTVGTKVYIDKYTNMIYTYTTSDSFLFESEKKISEAEQILDYYRNSSSDYNWKLPYSYISDAKEYLKKAEKNPREVQKYSRLAIDSANDALKSALPYKSTELKGIWLRPTETSETRIIETVNRIQQAGIDNIFLETYFHGKTIFPSKVMSEYGLTPQYETFQGIDPLKIYIREAHKRRMKIHVWFETFYVGNENPNSNSKSILAVYPSWGNKTKKDINSEGPSKSTSEHNGYFLDPSNPEVQEFLGKLAEEIITVYRPDGINIDYIRYPNSVGSNDNSNWGYTDVARNDFLAIYGTDPAQIKRNTQEAADWNAYRIEQVSNMVKKFGQIGRKNNVYVSAVIFPDRQAALNTKFQDWKTWSARGYLNGITPLFLTCDCKTANKMMTDVINSKAYNTDFYAGLFVTFMGGADEDLIRQIHEARKVNAKGVIIFDYAHLNNKYIETLSKGVFSRQSPFSQQQKYQEQEKRKGWKLFN